MTKQGDRSLAKGCAIVAAILLLPPIVIVGAVAVKTWLPLEQARTSLEKLEQGLGSESRYTPASHGGIPADRMELFLDLRASLVGACADYGDVQEGFEAVASLDSTTAPDTEGTVRVVRDLGGAALAITPFLARFFRLRNDALLAGSMSLEEYAYIYAVAYHARLLSEETRREIFSDGEALSPEASRMLRGCLARQLEATPEGESPRRAALEEELERMTSDSSRLLWQDGLPDEIAARILPYRERLDDTFCGATAGLEMERGSRRALWIALK